MKTSKQAIKIPMCQNYSKDKLSISTCVLVIFLLAGGINYHAHGLIQQRTYFVLPSQLAVWSRQDLPTDCHRPGAQAMDPVGPHQDDHLWSWWARKRTGTMADHLGWSLEARKLEEFGGAVLTQQYMSLQLILNGDQLRSYRVRHSIQCMLRWPKVRTFYRKIGICITYRHGS